MDHCFVYTFEHGCYQVQLYKRNDDYLYKQCVKIKDCFDLNIIFFSLELTLCQVKATSIVYQQIQELRIRKYANDNAKGL